MKSLFSCFPKKKSKSKIHKNNDNQPLSISEIKPNNHCSDTIVKEDIKLIEDEPKHDTGLVFIELEDDKEEQSSQKFDDRIRNALARIENVYSVLNHKNKMYNLPRVISDFKLLIDTELNNYIDQCRLLEDYFDLQSMFVADLFNVQSNLLELIHNQDYNLIDNLHDRFRKSIIELNRFCTKSDNNYQLNRFLSDSIMVFGWLCCFNLPSNFVQNVLDGTVMTAARMVNDSKYSKYSGWIKAWSCVLRAFSRIITCHFEAALMWRISGQVPMDILQCLVQCNYSNLNEESVPVLIKPKVVKTTAVNDISYETVTSLFDDLRSGRQKMNLKSVNKDEFKMDFSAHSNSLGREKQTLEIEEAPSLLGDSPDKRPFTFNNKTWIISRQTGNPDIEIPNKNVGNSVWISDCTDCSIQIDGRIKNVKLENSSNINLIIDEVSELFLVTDSSAIESQVLGSICQIDLRRVSKFRLFMPKEGSESVTILTNKCADIDIYVSKDEGGGLELEDYDRLTLGTQCRSALVDGSVSHSIA